MNTRSLLIAAAAALCLAPTTPAQDKPAADPPKTEKPKTPPADPPDPADGLDLDALLGTRKGETAPTAGDATKADLKRRLDARELGDAFQQAVALMGDAAGRLSSAKDTGVTTQRIQEDIIRKLDLLVEQLQQQSQSSQSRQQQQQQDQDSQSSSRRQQRQQQNDQRRGENNAELDPPARRDGQLGPDIDAARAGWGWLPDRERLMLMQGSTDRFSEAYKKLTAAYYRKLAEEGKK